MTQLTNEEYNSKFPQDFTITSATYVRDEDNNIIGVEFVVNGETWGCENNINNNLWQEVQERINNAGLVVDG